MMETNLNSNTDPAYRVAGQFASVLQATRYISEAWSAIAFAERVEMIDRWAQLIREDPDKGVQQILEDMQARSELRDAWNRLEPQERENRIRILKALVVSK